VVPVLSFDDSLEGKKAADPVKNEKMLYKTTNFRSKSFFWCIRFNILSFEF
jgi:hypothetical protein